jgi:hypothetical protein
MAKLCADLFKAHNFRMAFDFMFPPSPLAGLRMLTARNHTSLAAAVAKINPTNIAASHCSSSAEAGSAGKGANTADYGDHPAPAPHADVPGFGRLRPLDAMAADQKLASRAWLCHILRRFEGSIFRDYSDASG